MHTLERSVLRSCELTQVEEKDNTITSTVKFANGETETISSNWLIACDGANSTVRRLCQLFFPGKALGGQFVVADATMDAYMESNQIHAFFEPGSLFGAMPFSDTHYRILANLNLDHPRTLFTEREVIEMAQERAYGVTMSSMFLGFHPFG